MLAQIDACLLWLGTSFGDWDGMSEPKVFVITVVLISSSVDFALSGCRVLIDWLNHHLLHLPFTWLIGLWDDWKMAWTSYLSTDTKWVEKDLRAGDAFIRCSAQESLITCIFACKHTWFQNDSHLSRGSQLCVCMCVDSLRFIT